MRLKLYVASSVSGPNGFLNQSLAVSDDADLLRKKIEATAKKNNPLSNHSWDSKKMTYTEEEGEYGYFIQTCSDSEIVSIP